MQRQVFVSPPRGKHRFINLVAHRKIAAVIDYDQTRCQQTPLDFGLGIMNDLDSLANPAIEIQKWLVIFFVVNDQRVNMVQMRFIAGCTPPCKLMHRNSVNMALDIARDLFAGNRPCQFLAEVWLPRRPLENAIKRQPGIHNGKIDLRREYVEIVT